LNKEEITCPNCEAEFYVECDEDIIFCVVCGQEIGEDDEDSYEDEWDEE